MDLITLAMAKKYSDKKGGYTETVKNVVYEKAEFPFYPHENNLSVTQIFDEQKNVAVFPGMVLTVHYDGADYKCELVKADEEALYFGNIPTGNEWNESGMPFMGMVFADLGLSNITFLVNDTAESHIIGISISTEAIVPIDPKYLPGVCLPVVELSTEPTADGAELTADEAQVVEALNGGLAVFTLNFGSDRGRLTAIPFIVTAEGVSSYGFAIEAVTISLEKQDGVWIIYSDG